MASDVAVENTVLSCSAVLVKISVDTILSVYNSVDVSPSTDRDVIPVFETLALAVDKDVSKAFAFVSVEVDADTNPGPVVLVGNVNV